MKKYSEEDLQEFKKIILDHLDKAKNELAYSKEYIAKNDNSADNTSWKFNPEESGATSINREELSIIASRLQKRIVTLENALIRIENKTYGICHVSGQLIPKERLLASPVATTIISLK